MLQICAITSHQSSGCLLACSVALLLALLARILEVTAVKTAIVIYACWIRCCTFYDELIPSVLNGGFNEPG
jgi:hypothetical protein